MKADNQAYNTDTVGLGAFAPDSTVVEADSVTTPVVEEATVVEATEQHTVQPENTGSRSASSVPLILSGFSLLAVIVVASMMRKLKSGHEALARSLDAVMDKQEKTTNILSSQLADAMRRIGELREEVDTLSARQRTCCSLASDSQYTVPQSEHPAAVQTSVKKKDEEKTPVGNDRVFFGTPFAPDENGVVKFATRSISRDNSPQRMFALTLNPDGKGTYEVNPAANEYILSDLQLFSYFVKPFNFNGQISAARVATAKPGILVKSGAFWVVKEPMQVIFR